MARIKVVVSVVTLADRLPTEVDRLLLRIEAIQSSCPHVYRYLDVVELRQTRMAEVFFGDGEYSPGHTVQCMRCSHKKEVGMAEMCPQCLEPMTRDPRSFEVVDYYGLHDGTKEARVFFCSCGLRIVNKVGIEF